MWTEAVLVSPELRRVGVSVVRGLRLHPDGAGDGDLHVPVEEAFQPTHAASEDGPEDAVERTAQEEPEEDSHDDREGHEMPGLQLLRVCARPKHHIRGGRLAATCSILDGDRRSQPLPDCARAGGGGWTL